jgi:hypothetical protein
MKRMIDNGFVLFGVFICVFALSFVIATAVVAPTDLIFEGNTTAFYDEGEFSLNWTSGAGEVEENYTVFIYVDGTVFNSSLNDSETGYHFSNATEANYTFIVQAGNVTGEDIVNSTNISMYVDATAPVVTLPVYTNATIKNNTEMLTLNISVADALSGQNGSECLIDVNGTNQSISVSGGWCNSSSINLTGIADGNQTISVWANDTVNNLAVNNSFVVFIDTTVPTATAACTPTSVVTGNAVSCSCVGADTGSGVNATLTTAVSTPTTYLPGSFTYTCSVTDNAGNGASSTATYIVSASGSSNPSGPTYKPTSNKLNAGYTVLLAKGSSVNFDVAAASHSLKVEGVFGGSANITVSSDPVNFELNVGDTKKLDLNDDATYDISVLLKEIVGAKANVVLTSIDEAVPADASPVVASVDEEPTIDDDSDEGNGQIPWIIVGIIILVVVVALILKKFIRKG